jgi:hypothetical protein
MADVTMAANSAESDCKFTGALPAQ